MGLKADNRAIPKATEGNPPDVTPRYGHLLAEAWWDIANATEHVKSRDDVERYIRLGWGGGCARMLGYRLLGLPESDPPDIAAEWRMGLGTLVHEQLQATFVKVFPTASIEHVVGKEHDERFGFPVSGRTDIFLVEASGIEHGDEGDIGPKRTAIEVKTLNGFAFKKAIGARGVAEGPRTSALYQAALNGRALDVDEVVVVILSMECLSDRELTSLVKGSGGEASPARKFVAEWTYTMAELDDMVDREVKRLAKVMEMIDARAAWLLKIEDASEDPRNAPPEPPLPPRSTPHEMPPLARVTNAATGEWQRVDGDSVTQAGTYWGCNYCGHQKRCIEDGPS